MFHTLDHVVPDQFHFDTDPDPRIRLENTNIFLTLFFYTKYNASKNNLFAIHEQIIKMR